MNAKIDNIVFTVMVDDPDVGSNGEVRFSLESAEEVPFAVEAGGWVRVTGTLDRETRAEYRLPLRASDQGTRPRSARGELVVRLLDYNDCPPIFTQDVYEAEVIIFYWKPRHIRTIDYSPTHLPPYSYYPLIFQKIYNITNLNKFGSVRLNLGLILILKVIDL